MTVSMLTPVALEVPNMRITPAGVEPFHYPLSIQEVAAVRDSFLDSLFAWLRADGVRAGTPAEAVWIVLPHLVDELMRAFQRQALERRYAQAGIRVQGFDLETSRTAVPGPSAALERLLWRPGPNQPLMRAARKLRASLRSAQAFSYIRPGQAGGDVVITFQAPALVRAYAASVGEFPRLSRPDDWLVQNSAPENGLDKDGDTIVTEMFRQAFAAGGERLGQIAEAWLRRSAQLGTGWAHHQMRTLRGRKTLPRKFWSGTLGSPTNRAFVWAIRERGAAVTGFDHGMSTGMWDTPIQTMLEFDFVDRFVTFTQGMADGLRKNVSPTWSLAKSSPEVVAVMGREDDDRGASKAEPGAPPPAPITKVLYIPTLYAGDTVHVLPNISDLQMVDWQARLLATLRDRGYQLSIKVHPETRYPVPPGLAELVDGRVLTDRFENIDLSNTILLFDYPQTTALRHAVLSSCPLVIIDFDRLRIRPEALQAVDGRCARVPGALDENGRVQVDWDQLERAFAEAALRTDQTLAQLYVGNFR